MPTDAEKRDHPRKEFVVEAVLESSAGRVQSRISDISLGGCYVDSIAMAVKGEHLSLAIMWQGQRRYFTGEVAYVLPGFGFGIRFTELDEEQTEFLRRIIG